MDTVPDVDAGEAKDLAMGGVDYAKMLRADVKKAGGVWPAVVKKADAITPVFLGRAKKWLQVLAVAVFAGAFLTGFILSAVGNTADCSKENGCISCSIKSGSFDASEFSEGCEPLAVPAFPVGGTRCMSGQVENSKASLDAIADTSLLVKKLSKLCTASMSTYKCNGRWGDGSGGVGKDQKTLNDATRSRKPTLWECLGLWGYNSNTCETCNYAYTIQNAACHYIHGMDGDATVDNDATVCSEANMATLLKDWTNTAEIKVIKEALIFNSNGAVYDTSEAKLVELLGDGALAYDKWDQTSIIMDKLVNLNAIMCWIDQMYEELENPTLYDKQDPPEEREPPFVIAKQDITDKNGNPETFRAFVINPGAYASRCGLGLKGREEQTRINNNAGIWVVGLNCGKDGNCFFQMNAGHSTLCPKHDNTGTDVCQMPTYRVATTGEFSCCSRMSIGNVLSSAYAFGSLWLSVSGFVLAGVVLLLCGKDLVDLSEFKKGAGGAASGARAVSQGP